MKKQLADLLLYRWRYLLGYGALVALFVLSVTIASLYAPGGITQQEVEVIRATNLLAAGEVSVVNLPFHALQWLFFSLFGVSVLTIKLPSIVLAIAASVVTFFLLRRWFKASITILSMLIMVATGQILYIAQNATPDILYILYTALILLFASLIIQREKHQLLWKIGLALSVALSLYTPYFVYIALGLLIVAFLHPHTRHHMLRRKQRANWAIAGALLLTVAAPLVYFCITQPETLQSIAGIDLSSINIVDNLKLLLMSFFWIAPITSGGQILPVMDFASLALIILGVLVLFKQRHTARTYAMLTWIVLALPLIVLQPHLLAVIAVPLFVLLAIGVETLLYEWYKLFPKNPYARGVGLVFIIGLVSVMVLGGMDRFISGYRHTPEVVRNFSTDITLLRSELENRPVRTLLVVSDYEQPLFEALERYDSYDLHVTTNPRETQGISNILVTNAMQDTALSSWRLQQIITNERSDQADRLYLYNASET